MVFLVDGHIRALKLGTLRYHDGKARTATGSKYTLPGMRMRTLESSLCRPRLVEDIISPVLPSYPKREYFTLLCLDKCSNEPYFQLSL